MANPDTRKLLAKIVDITAADITTCWDGQLHWAALSGSLAKVVYDLADHLSDDQVGMLIRAAAMAQRQAMTPPIEAMPMEVRAMFGWPVEDLVEALK